MTRTKVYLILQAALCALLVALLSASAVSIYREGAARKAEHPLEPIYTREIAAEKFAPIAPVFFAAVGLTIAGLVLGAKDEGAEKPAREPELVRDLTVARVAWPSDAMRRAHEGDIAVLVVHSSMVLDDPAEYLADKGYAMPFATDDDDDTVAEIVGNTGTFPQTVVLNRRGEVVYNQVGSITPEMLSALYEQADQ